MDDGGPAFPIFKPNTDEGPEEYYLGMSLRDWFAGQFMTGFASCVNDADIRLRQKRHAVSCAKKVSAHAYLFADAMLAERAKK